MNIDGMTQLEIEEAFDESEMRIALTAEMEIFFNNVEQQYVDLMAKVLNTDNEEITNDMFIYILSVIGNEKVGIKIGLNRRHEECNVNSRYCVTITNKRDIQIYNLIQAIAKSPTMNKLTTHPLDRFDIAMNIVAEFDGILFDLHKKVVKLDDGQFVTETYARSEITFREEVGLRAQYHRFPLPMIEEPDDWTETQSGGYKLKKSKVTTNRGEGKQPQQVLDVLNKLQKQPYELVHNVSAEAENEYLYKTFQPKSLSAIEAQDKANALCLTVGETYEALRNKKFYFEWKFDFRGRMYSTGYDVNLQANKFKKGAIQPC